ncbi:kinase-like protein [Annulohypoxylon maeteangense]|uniref:kinase-like protein n=1 Tax=Annulohypoxylon maeteangense TaxID=1927788 RepID=UPI002007997B|nr:kinase-like protein [Annulohypoxylon maeteangense]KAI0883583.1 kinase-like protein [Annulohypoxylon maeteangense]
MGNHVQRNCQVLKECFSNNPRFEYKRLIAYGNYGSAHQVRYTDASQPDLKEFLVKRAFETQNAEDALRAEKGYLMRLRGSRHIVQVIDIPDNPLQNGPQSNVSGEWLILEWIPNGSLKRFMDNVFVMGLAPLPNRLLWRLFFCLIRACTAMAWPAERTDDLLQDEIPQERVRPSTLEHNDLHRGNILIGDFLPNIEHRISPILKIIDFGLTGEWAWAQGATPRGVPGNLWDVGAIMSMLITMDPYVRVELPGDCDPYELEHGSFQLRTQAHAILPLRVAGQGPFPTVDNMLKIHVAQCLATDPRDRPPLDSMHSWITRAITTRDGDYYGVDSEQDRAVEELCRRILFEPPIPPAGGGDGAVGGGADRPIELS